MYYPKRPVNRFRRFWREARDYALAGCYALGALALVGVIVCFFSFLLVIFCGLVALGIIILVGWFIVGKPITITVNNVPTYEIRRFKIRKL